MQTQIVYDGNLNVRRVRAMQRLAEVVIDRELHRSIQSIEQVQELKSHLKEAILASDIRCYVYLDVRVGNILYDMLYVGDFGIAARDRIDNPVFARCSRLHTMNTLVDISKLKKPLFGHPAETYRQLIDSNITECPVTDLIDTKYDMDLNAFRTSRIWATLKDCRAIVSERDDIDATLIYTLPQMFDFISTYPTQVKDSCPIHPTYQQLAISNWRDFLERE